MMMVWMWAGSCVGVHGFLLHDLVCWSLDVLGECLRCHYCGVGVGRCLVFARLRVVLGFFFMSYCGVSSGMRCWSCNGHALMCCVHDCVVICLFAIVVFRFLVSPILVNHFCCCALFLFRERSDWKRLVVASSGSSSSVASLR